MRVSVVAVLCVVVVVSVATSVSAGRPNFYMPPVTTLNQTTAMAYVGRYNDLMKSIMAKAQFKESNAPQASKLLYETNVMLNEPASHWNCGCEIAYTLYMKQTYVFNTITAGPDDGAVPYVFMVCFTDAQCPGAESSCMTHNEPHICKPWVYCGAMPNCPEHSLF